MTDLFLDDGKKKGGGLLKGRQGTGGKSPAKTKAAGKKKTGDGETKVPAATAKKLRELAKTIGLVELTDEQLRDFVDGCHVETEKTDGQKVSVRAMDFDEPTKGFLVEESMFDEGEGADAFDHSEAPGSTIAPDDEEPEGDLDQVLDHVRGLGFPNTTPAHGLDILGGEDVELEREDGGRYLVGRYDESLHVRATNLGEGPDLYSNPADDPDATDDPGAGEAQGGEEPPESSEPDPEDPPAGEGGQEPPSGPQEEPTELADDVKGVLKAVQRARAIDQVIRGLEGDLKDAKDEVKRIKDEIDEKSKELRETIRHTDPGPLFDRRPRCKRCQERSTDLAVGPEGSSWSTREVCPTCRKVLQEELDAAARGEAQEDAEDAGAGETTEEPEASTPCPYCAEDDEPEPLPGRTPEDGLYHDTADGWVPCTTPREDPPAEEPDDEEDEGGHGVDLEKLKFTRTNVAEAFDELVDRHGWDRVAWTLKPDYDQGKGLTKKITIGDVRSIAATLDG